MSKCRIIIRPNSYIESHLPGVHLDKAHKHKSYIQRNDCQLTKRFLLRCVEQAKVRRHLTRQSLRVKKRLVTRWVKIRIRVMRENK